MKKLLQLLAVLSALISPASAATYTILDSTGTTQTFAGSVDGSSNLLPAEVICGSATLATLYPTATNCAVVNALGQLLTLTTIIGTVTTVNPSVSAFGAPGPASGAAMGVNAPGTFDPLIQTHFSKAINISTSGVTLLQALTTSQTIYITSWDVQAPSGHLLLESGIPTQSFTASFATNVMTLTAAPNGTDGLFPGEVIAAAGVTGGTTVVALTGGTPNTIGATYSLSTTPGTLASRAVTAVGTNPCNVATALTGSYLMSGGQVGKGVGIGPVLVTAASVNLCAVTDAAVQYSGGFSGAQF